MIESERKALEAELRAARNAIFDCQEGSAQEEALENRMREIKAALYDCAFESVADQRKREALENERESAFQARRDFTRQFAERHPAFAAAFR